MTDHIGALEAMVAELSARHDIHVHMAKFHRPASDSQIRSAANYHPLTSGMLKFYRRCNGFV